MSSDPARGYSVATVIPKRGKSQESYNQCDYTVNVRIVLIRLAPQSNSLMVKCCDMIT